MYPYADHKFIPITPIDTHDQRLMLPKNKSWILLLFILYYIMLSLIDSYPMKIKSYNITEITSK